MSKNRLNSWPLKLLAAVLLILVSDSPAASKDIKCKGVKLQRIGCYEDNPKSHLLPNLLLTFVSNRSPVYAGKRVTWGRYDVFMKQLICACAEKALKQGYSVMGLQNYGECWSGRDSTKFKNFGRSRRCVNWKYKQCSPGMDCVGGQKSYFVYGVTKDSVSPTTKPTAKVSPSAKPTVTAKVSPPTKPTAKVSPTAKPTVIAKVSSTSKSTLTPSKSRSTTSLSKATTIRLGIYSLTPSGSGTSTAKPPHSPTENPVPCTNVIPPMACIQTIQPCTPCHPLTAPAPAMPYPGHFSHSTPNGYGQYQGHVPCGISCSPQCAPKCTSECCSNFHIPVGHPRHDRVRSLNKVQCKYGCSSKCAPRCTARCCRLQLSVEAMLPDLFPKRYFAGVSDNVIQSSLFGRKQCGQDCSSKCAPRCSFKCCSALKRRLPFQEQPSVFWGNQQEALLHKHDCRQGCSLRCAPKCLKGCCRWFGGLYKKTMIRKHVIPSLEDN